MIVGAYPVYDRMADPREVVAALARDPLVAGLEVPFDGGAIQVPAGGSPHWRYVVTVLPGTVRTLHDDPCFGLASPDARGRAAALAQVRELQQSVVRGDQRILAVELPSAPRRVGVGEALAASLKEIAGWDWGGTAVCVEHCDAWTDSPFVQKGFLSLEAELEAVSAAGLSMVLNWGRSVIEDRDPEAGLRHIRRVVQRGLLSGVIFSSVSDRENPQGVAWADAHLASRELLAPESGSLLDAQAIRSCLDAAGPVWRGFKVTVPAEIPPSGYAPFLHRAAELIERQVECLTADAGV